MTTILEVTEVHEGGTERQLPSTSSFTQPLPPDQIASAIGEIVLRADEEYALEFVTVLQVKARLADDPGTRLSFEEFATEAGFDLEQLRAGE